MAVRSKAGQFVPPPVKKADKAETTGAQPNGTKSTYPSWLNFSLLEKSGCGGNGMLFAAGAYSSQNPMGFPGYGTFVYSGTPTTYRWMLQHPVVRLVRSISVGEIVASTWEYEKSDAKDPKIKDEWLEHVRKTFDALRNDLVNDFYVDGRDMGWKGGEPIWEYEDGFIWLRRVKPLVGDVTDILEDDNGNFTGLRNNVRIGSQSSVDLPAPFKAWKFTYDKSANRNHGRSWLENIRATAWLDWLDCAQQLQRLGSKISGIVTVIMSPAGTFPGPPDSSGKQTTVSYRENAEAAIKGLASGAEGVWFPSLGLAPDAKGNIDAMKVLVELAGKSLTTLDVKDFSGNASAIGPILERMKHAEELIFNGGLRSARVGLEAKHGTKEEAGTHTDTGTVNAENEDEDFARQVQGLVDATLELNFTPNARGKIRVKTPSLVDRKTAIMRMLLAAAYNQPAIAVSLAKITDWSAVLRTLDIATKGDITPADIDKAVEQLTKKQPDKAADTSPEGGKPPQG